MSTGGDGVLRLSWTERAADGSASLHVSDFDAARGTFGAARVVAEGTGWFVNWADVPDFGAMPSGTLFGTFLRKLGEGTYAYGVHLTHSKDGGTTWSEARLLHEDASESEHGFVSLAPLAGGSDGRLCAVWLDGRDTAHDPPGSMNLRAAWIDSEGEVHAERLLDPRVCDCCPLALLALPGGQAVVAYRDRSDDEVRDISLLRFDPLDPASEAVRGSVAADGWQIEGCPVNGPVLSTDGSRLALAWFTGADERPRIMVASIDESLDSREPLMISDDAVFGSMSAVHDEDGALLVTWLQEGTPSGRWMLSRIDFEDESTITTTLTDAPAGRAAGIARLARHADTVLFAWTYHDGVRVAWIE